MSDQLHFEDFSVGQIFALGPRTVVREEVLAFAKAFDPQAFHLDESAAEAGIFGRLSASGWHTCSMMMRMICDACFSQTAVLGAPGVDSIKWKNPVFPGDILSGTFEITRKRLSASRSGVGILHVDAKVHDQHGLPKAEFEGPVFVRSRA